MRSADKITPPDIAAGTQHAGTTADNYPGARQPVDAATPLSTLRKSQRHVPHPEPGGSFQWQARFWVTVSGPNREAIDKILQVLQQTLHPYAVSLGVHIRLDEVPLAGADRAEVLRRACAHIVQKHSQWIEGYEIESAPGVDEAVVFYVRRELQPAEFDLISSDFIEYGIPTPNWRAVIINDRTQQQPAE